MHNLLSFALGLAVVLAAPPSANAENWLTYQNDHYGTTIDYPNVFKAQRPPDSDDGRAFKSADGADFTVAKYRDFSIAVAS